MVISILYIGTVAPKGRKAWKPRGIAKLLYADIWVQTEVNYNDTRGSENMTGLFITPVPPYAFYTLVYVLIFHGLF